MAERSHGAGMPTQRLKSFDDEDLHYRMIEVRV